MSNNKITFVFGAGASQGCLPIVSEIPEKLMIFSKDIGRALVEAKDFNFTASVDSRISSKSYAEWLSEMCVAVKWLAAQCKLHSSIDTFAKKLFIKQEKKELLKLKAVLSTFFKYTQTQSNFDLRYDSFLCSIINEKGRLPENVRVISWNYDNQFELAYRSFVSSDHAPIDQMALELNIKTARNYSFSRSGFSIFKMNGTSSVWSSNESSNFSYLKLMENYGGMHSFWNELVLYYATALEILPDYQNAIRFAWEQDNDYEAKFMEHVKGEIQGSNILVVIGYSFPFFNRIIDRNWLDGLELDKIYIQSRNPKTIETTFSSLIDYNPKKGIVLVDDVAVFKLPFEL